MAVNGLGVIGTVAIDMFSPAWVARGLYHSECLLTLKPLFFTTVYLSFIFCYFCCRAPVKQSLLCEVAEF